MNKYKLAALFVLAFLAGFVFGTLPGCTTAPKTHPLPSEEDEVMYALSWDNDVRAAWSKDLNSLVNQYWASLSKATDMKKICPKYESVNKKRVWAEFIVATAYYESGWNPKSASVDVGKPESKNTWSVGLMQVSVVDQAWAGGNLKYSYDELLTPKPNLHLAMQLMSRQIDKTGSALLPNSSKYRYWAVLLEGNKYSKIPQIAGRVQKAIKECI